MREFRESLKVNDNPERKLGYKKEKEKEDDEKDLSLEEKQAKRRAEYEAIGFDDDDYER